MLAKPALVALLVVAAAGCARPRGRAVGAFHRASDAATGQPATRGGEASDVALFAARAEVARLSSLAKDEQRAAVVAQARQLSRIASWLGGIALLAGCVALCFPLVRGLGATVATAGAVLLVCAQALGVAAPWLWIVGLVLIAGVLVLAVVALARHKGAVASLVGAVEKLKPTLDRSLGVSGRKATLATLVGKAAPTIACIRKKLGHT